MQSMKLLNISSSSDSDDSPAAIPKLNPGPKSNASGPKSLAMASMMQTLNDSSSSDSDSDSEMRPGPNASKLKMNETISPTKTSDGPTKPAFTGPASMSSKLNSMIDSSSDSDSSGDEIAVVTSSTAPTTVESTIPTKTQDAPAGVISGPASLASRLNDLSSDSDSASDEEVVQVKPSMERSIPTKTSDAPNSGVMSGGPVSMASKIDTLLSSSSSEDEEDQAVRPTSLQPASAQPSIPTNNNRLSSSSSSEDEQELAVNPLQGNPPSMEFQELPSAGSFDLQATGGSLPLSQMDSMPKSKLSENIEDSSSSSDEEIPPQQSLIESLPPADYQQNSEASTIPNRSAPSFYDNVRPVVVAKQVEIGSGNELSGLDWSDNDSSRASIVKETPNEQKPQPEIGETVNDEIGLGNELVSATPAKKFLEKIKSVAVGESFSWGEETYKKLFDPIWV